MLAAVFFLTGLAVRGCNYILVDDTKSYTRLKLHSLIVPKPEIRKENQQHSLYIPQGICPEYHPGQVCKAELQHPFHS